MHPSAYKFADSILVQCCRHTSLPDDRLLDVKNIIPGAAELDSAISIILGTITWTYSWTWTQGSGGYLRLAKCRLAQCREGRAKIADVGLSQVLQNTYLSQVDGLGTFAYAAPELLAGGSNCSTKADIWR